MTVVAPECSDMRHPQSSNLKIEFKLEVELKHIDQIIHREPFWNIPGISHSRGRMAV